MKKYQSIKLIIVSLFVVIIITMSSTAFAGSGKRYFFIVTDGITDPEMNYHHYTDKWTGQGLEERIILIEWYAFYKDEIFSASFQGWKIGGVKIEYKVYNLGDDIFLYIRIFKGGYYEPKISETIVWQIVNGMDSTNHRFTSVLTSIDTGRLSKTITLNIGEEGIIGLPSSDSYSCRMWLI